LIINKIFSCSVTIYYKSDKKIEDKSTLWMTWSLFEYKSLCWF